MTRAALFAAAVVVAAGLVRADDVPVAPPPRPAGVKPKPPVPKPGDPAATVEKIIRNTKDTADRLAKADTGTGTRKIQDETLALIDSLLDGAENPPPQPDQNPQQNPESKSNPDPKQESKSQDMNQGGAGTGQDKDSDPKGGKPEDKKGGQSKAGGQEPKKEPGSKSEQAKGGDQASGGRKPPEKGGQEAKSEPGPKNEPMPGGGRAKEGAKGPKDDPQAGRIGGVAGKQPPGKAPLRPSLLLDEEIAKQVWGHLREKERQQAMQWFNERYMPKYEDLLNLYFSSLGDRRPAAEQRK